MDANRAGDIAMPNASVKSPLELAPPPERVRRADRRD
jgi:hypothetical protein